MCKAIDKVLKRDKPKERLEDYEVIADAINHGYGLKSCSRISQKWNGDMSWECSDGVFTLDIFVQDIPAIKE